MFAPHVIDEEFLFLIYKMFLEIIRKRLLKKMAMDIGHRKENTNDP